MFSVARRRGGLPTRTSRASSFLVVSSWLEDFSRSRFQRENTMLEFYPPAPGSFNQGSFKSEPGQPLPAVPPIPFRPTADNNNAGEQESVRTVP